MGTLPSCQSPSKKVHVFDGLVSAGKRFTSPKYFDKNVDGCQLLYRLQQSRQRRTQLWGIAPAQIAAVRLNVFIQLEPTYSSNRQGVIIANARLSGSIVARSCHIVISLWCYTLG